MDLQASRSRARIGLAGEPILLLEQDRGPWEPSLASYHLLPSVRGDLLAKLGRFGEAHAEFERAAALTRNVRERELLLERAAACARGTVPR